MIMQKIVQITKNQTFLQNVNVATNYLVQKNTKIFYITQYKIV